MELLTWEAFSLLTGKHIDLKKRIGQKIRVFRDGGNVYVSDHSWVLFQNYKKDNIRAQCAHIGGATGEALLNNLRSRLNVIVGTEPLAWTIE